MSTTGPFAFTKALMDYFREQTVGRCHMKTHPKGGMPWSLPNVCYCLVAGQSSGLRCLGGIDIDFAFNWILCWSVILFLFAHTLFLLLTTLPISTFRYILIHSPPAPLSKRSLLFVWNGTARVRELRDIVKEKSISILTTRFFVIKKNKYSTKASYIQ